MRKQAHHDGTFDERGALEQLAADEVENDETVKQEREEESLSGCDALNYSYPVPSCIWQGVFSEVAEQIEERSWPVWLGTYVALMARVGRRIQLDFFKSLLCGMPYALMIGHTGSRKGLAARVCHELMPEGFCVRRGVSSGPGLVEVLRDKLYESHEEGGNTAPIPTRPALLIMEEWTVFLKYAGLSGATLFEDLNELYHTRFNWNVTTKKRKGEGGDQNLRTPSLSLLGTTTPKGYYRYVTEDMIERGFVNRHLILPCVSSEQFIPWRDPEHRAGKNGAHHLFDSLLDDYISPPAAWASGTLPFENCFDGEATRAMAAWVEQRVTSEKNKYLNQSPPLIHTATIPRLDRHGIQIALSYALATRSQMISLAHVEAAIAIADTTWLFTTRLTEERPTHLPAREAHHKVIDDMILNKIHEQTGCTREQIKQILKRHASYPEIGQRIDLLLQQKVISEARLHGTRQRGLFLCQGF